MKHSSLYGWLALVILCTILSCTDHRDLPPTARFRVKTVKSSQVDFTHVLTYDNLGRLASYTSPSSESFSKGITLFDYKSSNGYDFSTTRFITKPQAIIIGYKFDGQHRLSQVDYIDANAGGGVWVSYYRIITSIQLITPFHHRRSQPDL